MHPKTMFGSVKLERNVTKDRKEKWKEKNVYVQS